MTRLALLDRAGAIKEHLADGMKTLDELVLLSGSAAAIACLNAAGVMVALVANEPARGMWPLSMQAMERIHAGPGVPLARGGAHLDAVLACRSFRSRRCPPEGRAVVSV